MRATAVEAEAVARMRRKVRRSCFLGVGVGLEVCSERKSEGGETRQLLLSPLNTTHTVRRRTRAQSVQGAVAVMVAARLAL